MISSRTVKREMLIMFKFYLKMGLKDYLKKCFLEWTNMFSGVQSGLQLPFRALFVTDTTTLLTTWKHSVSQMDSVGAL